jgi:hypothetical protein
VRRLAVLLGAAFAALLISCQPALALVTAPTYLDPAGRPAAAIGIVCINPDLSSCTFGGGGGSSYTAAAAPFAVSAGINKPAFIDTANSAQGVEICIPGTLVCIDPTTPSGIGTTQSGVPNVAVIGCDLHTFYDASDNGKKTIVAGQSGKRIYVCGYVLATGGTATNMELGEGTGTDCVTTYTKRSPAYQLVANDRVGANAAFYNGFSTQANAANLCKNGSAANPQQVEVWYTVQ